MWLRPNKWSHAFVKTVLAEKERVNRLQYLRCCAYRSAIITASVSLANSPTLWERSCMADSVPYTTCFMILSCVHNSGDRPSFLSLLSPQFSAHYHTSLHLLAPLFSQFLRLHGFYLRDAALNRSTSHLFIGAHDQWFCSHLTLGCLPYHGEPDP